MIIYRLDDNFNIVSSQNDGQLELNVNYAVQVDYSSVGKAFASPRLNVTPKVKSGYSSSATGFITVRYYNARTPEFAVGNKLTVEYTGTRSASCKGNTAQNIEGTHASNVCNAEIFNISFNNTAFGGYTVNSVTVVEDPTATFSIVSTLTNASLLYDEANTFNVSAKENEYMFTQFDVASGKLLYKIAGAASYTQIAFTGKSVTVPANTFVTGKSYECYIEAVESTTSATAQTAVYTITEVDQTPHAVGVSPSGTVEHGKVTFEWNYYIGTNTPQKKFTLQISDDNVTWTTVKTSSQQTPRYTAQISGSGNKWWRVRTFSQKDAQSEYSEPLFFINRVRPAAPTSISFAGTGRKTMRWNSTDQIAYEAELGNFKSGIVYSSDTKHYFNDYLPSGTYTARVRVYNRYGDASEWAEIEYTQSTTATVPAYKVSQVENGVLINTTNFWSFKRVYLLRNGELVCKLDGAIYIDYFTNGHTVYTLRGVLSNDNFCDTTFEITYNCKVSRLITMDGTVIDIAKRLDNHPGVNYALSLQFQEMQFLGRSKPVHFNGSIYTRRWNVICNGEDIKDHLGEVLFYRNYRGEKAFVKVYSVNMSHEYYGSEVSVQLVETDGIEAVQYE